MPNSLITTIVLALSCCVCVACGKSEPPATPIAEQHPIAPPAPSPSPSPAAPALLDPPDPNVACGQVIVVAWQGADHADAAITRDKAAAKARADELLAKVRAGQPFDALAGTDSDAPASKIRGGVMGTYTKDEWPPIHAALSDTVFALKVNEVAAQPVEAPYGYAIVRRCPVETAHGAHILIRYVGAKRAPEELTRTKDAARKLADEVHQKVTAPGASFADLAKQYSEDGSGENGGDIGSPGRGRLALPFEQTLFALQVGAISGVVESEYGFHIITRLPSE